MRLIDETAYQRKIAKIPMEERTFVRAWETAQNMPTIDAMPVVRGEWDADPCGWHCSECGADGRASWHYCPNCGAKMEDKP